MLFPPLALSDYFHLLLVCVGVSLTSVLSLVTVFSMRLTKLQLIKNKLKCTHVKLISGLTHVFCFVFFFKLYYLQIGSFQRYWLLIASTTADINFCQIAWLWGLRADLSLHAIVIVIQSANSCGKKEKTPWKLYKCKTSRIFFHVGLRKSVAYPEAIRVHFEFLKMQPAQISIRPFHVVHVVHCFVQSLQHHPSMSRHFVVFQNSSDGEEISKRTKISLSPGVDYQDSDNATVSGTG